MKYIYNIGASTPGAIILQPQQPWLEAIFCGSTFDWSNVRFGHESGRYVSYLRVVCFVSNVPRIKIYPN